MKKIIIGSRGSKLALLYAEKAKQYLINSGNLTKEEILIKKIVTKGDQVQDKRLSEIGGKGLFSKNIEKELLDKNIDIAVHALKDMPAIETGGLYSNCYLKRNDSREVLISRDGKNIKDIKQNAVIGTSSYRRDFQINRLRNDLKSKLIRGNVDTRIQKLQDGNYDAIILSLAGLKFLNLEKKISQIFSIDEIIPSAGQGIITLQCRNDDQETKSLLKKTNDSETEIRATAERNVLKILEGDCETAVGAHSFIKDKKITLKAELFSLDGTQKYYEEGTDDIENYKELGLEIGKKLKFKSGDNYKK
ncbi:hydroxymethylbilane synthase [Candidatus Pelagibacter sp.]|uniref:hydroxymethylbilane synthase n=1 Tax=Candidatus Pelagibacter sp. TaxID=2024849 RepID=UPI003F82B64F